jgi:anti-anti-sigma factor
MTSPTCPPDDQGTLAGDLTVAPTQPRPGLVLVRVLGEVDMLTARRLATVLQTAIATVADDRDTGPLDDEPSVVCDLEGVTFFGATGLDTVAAAHEEAVGLGVGLVVVAGCRTVRRPFRLTALDLSVTLTSTHPAVGRASTRPAAER